jgi:hypothetical protein
MLSYALGKCLPVSELFTNTAELSGGGSSIAQVASLTSLFNQVSGLRLFF